MLPCHTYTEYRIQEFLNAEYPDSCYLAKLNSYCFDYKDRWRKCCMLHPHCSSDYNGQIWPQKSFWTSPLLIESRKLQRNTSGKIQVKFCVGLDSDLLCVCSSQHSWRDGSSESQRIECRNIQKAPVMPSITEICNT